MSFWKGVKGSKGYCTVNPHPDACLINLARGYPGSVWCSRAARQGSKLFSSGWSPSCLGSSKNEGKPSPQNILGLSPVDTSTLSQAGFSGKQTLGWRLVCRKFLKEWPWGQQRKRRRKDEQREKSDANAVPMEASPDPGPSGSSENGMSFQSCPEQGEGSSLPPLSITH